MQQNVSINGNWWGILTMDNAFIILDLFPYGATSMKSNHRTDRHSFKKLHSLTFQQDWSIRKFTMRFPSLQFHPPQYPLINCFHAGNLWTSFFFFSEEPYFCCCIKWLSLEVRSEKAQIESLGKKRERERVAASVLVVQQKDIAEKSTTAILGFKAPRIRLKKATKTMKLSRRKEVVKSHLLARSRGKDSILILG